MDESGFSLLPLIRRTWAPKGQTPILWHTGRHRDKISCISAVTVSPRRRKLGLYLRFHPDKSLKAPDAAAFLVLLLRHLPGNLELLWDRGQIHRGGVVKELLLKHRPRLRTHFLPPYAPDLNPDEFVWTELKYRRLSNHGLPDVPTLHRRLHSQTRRLKTDQQFLWSCIESSKLPLRRP